MRGRRVLLVDADPQHSALDWQEAREQEPLCSAVGLPTKALHRDVAMQAKAHAYIIVDGPPRVNELARTAILGAVVSPRVAFAESIATGSTVLEQDPVS